MLDDEDDPLQELQRRKREATVAAERERRRKSVGKTGLPVEPSAEVSQNVSRETIPTLRDRAAMLRATAPTSPPAEPSPVRETLGDMARQAGNFARGVPLGLAESGTSIAGAIGGVADKLVDTGIPDWARRTNEQAEEFYHPEGGAGAAGTMAGGLAGSTALLMAGGTPAARLLGVRGVQTLARPAARYVGEKLGRDVSDIPETSALEAGMAGLDVQFGASLHGGIGGDIGRVLDRQSAADQAARTLESARIRGTAAARLKRMSGRLLPAETGPFDEPMHGQAPPSSDQQAALAAEEPAHAMNAARDAVANEPPSSVSEALRRFEAEQARGQNARDRYDVIPPQPPPGPNVDTRPLREILRDAQPTLRPDEATAADVAAHRAQRGPTPAQARVEEPLPPDETQAGAEAIGPTAPGFPRKRVLSDAERELEMEQLGKRDEQRAADAAAAEAAADAARPHTHARVLGDRGGNLRRLSDVKTAAIEDELARLKQQHAENLHRYTGNYLTQDQVEAYADSEAGARAPKRGKDSLGLTRRENGGLTPGEAKREADPEQLASPSATAEEARLQRTMQRLTDELDARRGSPREPATGGFVDPETGRPGYAAAGQLGILTAPGIGAAAGAALAPEGQRKEGAAIGAVVGLGGAVLGASRLRQFSEARAARAAEVARRAEDPAARMTRLLREQRGRPASETPYENIAINGVPHHMSVNAGEARPGRFNRIGAIGDLPSLFEGDEGRDLFGGAANMRETSVGKRQPTQSAMRDAIAAVGDDEFRSRVKLHLEDLGEDLSPEEHAAEVEGVARTIVNEHAPAGAISAKEMAARRDELGSPKSEAEATATPDQGELGGGLTLDQHTHRDVRAAAERMRAAGRETEAEFAHEVADYMEPGQEPHQLPGGRTYREALKHIDEADARFARGDVTRDLEKSLPSNADPLEQLKDSKKATDGLQGTLFATGGLGHALTTELGKNALTATVGAAAGAAIDKENPKTGAVVGALGLLGARKLVNNLTGPRTPARRLTRPEMDTRARMGPEASMRNTSTSPRDVRDALESTLTPAARSSESSLTEGIVREKRGQMDRDLAVTRNALESVQGTLQKKPVADKLAFVHAVETGAKQADPALQPVADGIRKALDTERDKIRALGTGKLDNFIENYFPHIWQDPNAASAWLGKVLGRRPMEGSKSFLKQRTIPTVQEGMEAGLVPVSYDPVELTMLKLREMRKYRMAQEVIGDMKSRGLLQKVAEPGRLPLGHALLTDRAFQGYSAPEPVAKLINNYLSPGLRGNAAFDAYMGAGNVMNSVQLGLSAFHAGMTTVEAAVSQTANAVGDLFKGNLGEAARTLTKGRAAGAVAGGVIGAATSKEGDKPLGRAVAGGVIGALVGGALGQVGRGNRLANAYKADPTILDPQTREMVESIAKAGGRPKMEYAGQARKDFTAALQGKQFGRAAAKFLPATLETLMIPLFDKLVPAQKLAVFSDMASRDIAAHAGGNPDELRAALQKSWNSTDNRMGSVVYDNLFWPKAVKDMMHATVRSVGWNWGTFRELGGGAADLGQYLKNAATAGKTAELSKRAQYLIALPMTVGLLGAATQYMYTGTMPETLFDYFHPKTGTKDADGNDNRIVLPTYMKDVFAYGKDIAKGRPLNTIKHKLSPLLTTAINMLENQDYYGDEIANMDDPFVQRWQQRAAYAAKESQPFFVQNVQEDTKRHASGVERAATFVGVTPANREDVRTNAQNTMQGYLAKRTPERTPEEAEASRQRADLRNIVRTQGPDAAKAELKKRIEAGQLTRAQVKAVLESGHTSSIETQFKQLTLTEAERVFAQGNAREKQLWAPLLQTKRSNARSRGIPNVSSAPISPPPPQ